jgi:hypothetical protein
VEGKAQLDAAREVLRYLCEPVAQPREMEQYLHYFCGDASNANALAETERFESPSTKLPPPFFALTRTLLKILARPDIRPPRSLG